MKCSIHILRILLLGGAFVLAASGQGANGAKSEIADTSTTSFSAVEGEHERDVWLYLALKASPERAIARLREMYPTDAKALACIQLIKSIGKSCEFRFTALDGRLVDSRDYLGKVVLLEFWSKDCSPCVAAMPKLMALAENNAPRGLAVIGISLEADRANAESIVSKFSLPWPEHFDGKGWQNEMAQRFMVYAIPNIVLIDRKGNLRFLQNYPGTTETNERIETLLAEPSQPTEPTAKAAAHQ